MKPVSVKSEQTYDIELNRENAIERRKTKRGMTNEVVNTVKEFSTPSKQGRNLETCPLTPAQISKIEMNRSAAVERRKYIKEREQDDEMLKIADFYENNHISPILQFDSNSLPASQDRNSFNMSQYPDESVDAYHQLSPDQLFKIEMNKMAALEKRKRKREQEEEERVRAAAMFDNVYSLGPSKSYFQQITVLPSSQPIDDFQDMEEFTCPLTPDQLQRIEESKMAALQRRKKRKEQQEREEIIETTPYYDYNSPSSTQALNVELFPFNQQGGCINVQSFPEVIGQSSSTFSELRHRQDHNQTAEIGKKEDEEVDLSEFHDCHEGEEPEIWYL
jgi:hypothetical protein